MDYGTWKHQNAIDNYSFDLFPSTFACYRTRLKKLGPFEVCEADFVRARNLSMTAQRENYTIFYINTPGRLRGRTYVNRYYFDIYEVVYSARSPWDQHILATIIQTGGCYKWVITMHDHYKQVSPQVYVHV